MKILLMQKDKATFRHPKEYRCTEENSVLL